MTTTLENYAAEFPDGSIIPVDKPQHSNPRMRTSPEDICREAVRLSTLTTSRQHPQVIRIRLHKLTIEKGEVKRLPIGSYDIQPPYARMTDTEYTDEMDEILSELPPEFRSYVQTMAYDDGHSAGYEEVVNIARNMVYGLKTAVAAYSIRILQSPK